MSNYVQATNFATKDSLPTGDPLKIVKGTEINTEFANIAIAVATKADLLSPTFTGTPAAPTASAGTNSTQLATTAYADAAIIAERTATATLTNKTLTSPTLTSPTLTGTPVAPTASVGTNTTQLATTAYVIAERTATATLTNKTLTTPNIDSAQFATVSGTAPIYPCRAWVNFDGTGTVAIRASGNVSSITDGGVGIYTVNLTTALPDTNYSVVGTQAIRSSTFTGGFGVEAEPSTTSACLVRTYSGGALADLATVSVSIFR